MLVPLQQWICDHCGEIIQRPEDGYAEWISDCENSSKGAKGFKIVHHAPASPRQPHGDCYFYEASSLALSDMIGPTGLVRLLAHLDVGPQHDPDANRSPRIANFREYTEFFRRLHVPYYEEARQYWSKAKDDGFFDGASEVWIYMPRTLQKLVERYASA